MDLTNINHIKALLLRHGFRFSKSMGQNFLCAPWVVEDMIYGAKLDETVGVLEIGPGIGALTKELAQSAGQVVSVELDRSLLPILKETLADYDNATVVSADILKTDLEALVAEHFAGLKPVVCANLPYNITSPVVTKLIDSGLFSEITVMVQREVARRMCAAPATADFSAFSLYIDYYCQAEILFDIPPECFIPAPKVHSSIVRLCKRDEPKVDVDEKTLFQLIKIAFAQRRKTLVNNIMSSNLQVEKEQVLEALEQMGLDAKIRGEALGLEQFAKLVKAFEK